MKDFYETTVRVRYTETDKFGVVYYANYFVWFEVGRAELLRQLGYDYKQMELKDDSHIVVAEARSRTLRFAYEIVNEATGERLATGETIHVVCDRHGRPKLLPAKYRKLFAPHPAHAAH